MNKVVLITGCSSGIGKAIAEAFLADGHWSVVATARRRDALVELEARGAHTRALDVTDEASMTAAVDAVVAQHGTVDVLVNNAGYSLPGPLEEVPMTALRQVFETNVFGLLRMCQLVLPHMRRRGVGRIINIGSMGGNFTTPGSAAYHMTKWAVESLSDGLRAEVAGFGVDVVLVQPGGVRTPFIHNANSHLDLSADDDSPYAVFKANIARNTTRIYAANSIWEVLAPQDVARVVLRAARTRRPRTRYPIGVLARVMPLLARTLPDRVFDRMWLSQFPMK